MQRLSKNLYDYLNENQSKFMSVSLDKKASDPEENFQSTNSTIESIASKLESFKKPRN